VARTYVAGYGYHHPEERLTNADLVATLDTTAEWIESHTGILERRRAVDGVDTSDLAVTAVRNALEASDWSEGDVELLICATSTPDTLAPATASWIAGKLGMAAVPFDMNASCSGFIYGLAVADAMMTTRGLRRIVLTAAEKYSRVVDHTDRRFEIFFGDSAGALLLQPEPPAVGLELVDLTMDARNAGTELAITPVQGFFSMDGAAIKPIATDMLVRSASDVLERNGLDVSSLRAFMGHQMNWRLLESLVDALGVSEEQHWHNVQTAGNQGGAGVLTTLCAGLDERADELRDGDLLLLTVVGSGFTAGSALLRYVDTR
jgi:3-oxoacyl-[acyl-carrier-protein] synthase III